MRIELKEITIDEPEKTVKAIRLEFSNKTNIAVGIEKPYDRRAVSFALVKLANQLLRADGKPSPPKGRFSHG